MSSTTEQTWLEHRTNNAYDTILLVRRDELATYVVGAWRTDRADKVWADYNNPGDLGDWPMNLADGDSQDPEAYGALADSTDPQDI